MNTYMLKKYDDALCKFQIGKTKFEDILIEILWITPRKELLPEKFDGSAKMLKNWLQDRMLPRNRAFVKEILVSQGLDEHDLEGILRISMALSVNDVYWVTPIKFIGSFDAYNLYESSFSEALSLVAFTGNSDTIEELSPSPEMTTNGMLPKAWRRIDNELLLFKGGKNLDSYTNGGKEPYSEYYAAQIAQKMGLFHVAYDLRKWKGILASVCSNFTTKDVSYVPIGYVLKEYSLNTLVDSLTTLGFFREFKNMILFDAVINNEDRHFGNFGLLKDNHTNEYIGFAPLFDHGISLFAYVRDEILLDKQQFKEYQLAHKQSAIGPTHEKLVKWFCTKEDITMLRGLYDFHFMMHTMYNLSTERIQILEEYVHARARYLTDIINKREECADNHIDDIKQINIQGEFLGYRYQFIGNDITGGTCILMDLNNRHIDKYVIEEKDLKDMDVITYIENRIENL